MVDTETRIRELEHRFRNILTVVRSLVSQSLQAADSIEDARSTIDERLAALGNATEQLLSHNWQAAPLPALAENALGHFTLYAERSASTAPRSRSAPRRR
jgi:two-component sensor histidine kinase